MPEYFYFPTHLNQNTSSNLVGLNPFSIYDYKVKGKDGSITP